MEGKNRNAWWLAAAAGIGAITAYTLLVKPRLKYSFEGKTVLITGGSRGLGLVLARMLADEGARIAICARKDDELDRAKEDLRNRGAEVFSTICDVRNQNEVNRMIDEICNHYGQIDVLINNAGVIQVGPLELQTKEDFEEAMAVHFWAAYYTMSAVVPQMRERGEGKIVNISSIGGKISVPHLVPYCASKFALVGLSKGFGVELSKDNIDVTTVCPGLMRTGSPVNAFFKGKNELEYAWFSIGDALPVTSVSVEYAARKIIEACRSGEAELIISPQAVLAAKANELFPEISAAILGLVNQVLPAPGGIGERRGLGKDSTSAISPSILTYLSDKEAYQNNELKPGEELG